MKYDFHVGWRYLLPCPSRLMGTIIKLGRLGGRQVIHKHTSHTRMYTNTHTYTQPDVRSRWNMDPNGCVPSLKGLGVDLSTVKQLVLLPWGEEGGGGELEVTGLNLNPCRKHLALRRRHASAFYADLWHQNLCAERIAVREPDIKVELKLSLHPMPKNNSSLWANSCLPSLLH